MNLIKNTSLYYNLFVIESVSFVIRILVHSCKLLTNKRK
jgi:hypothetical protein